MTPATQNGSETALDAFEGTMDARLSEATASAFETPGVMRVSASDADEFGESVRDWNIELKQLQPGGFRGEVTVLPLGPVLICSGHYGQSLLQRVGVPE